MFLSTEKEARNASAFFATGVQDGYEDTAYKSGDRLVYSNIRVNPGGQYNSTTGEYSCEKTGVYYFTYNIYGFRLKDSHRNNCASASLMKQGVKQAEVWSSNDNTGLIYITLSQSAVLQCNAGEKVWLESRYSNNYIRGFSDRTLFAGVLLYMI